MVTRELTERSISKFAANVISGAKQNLLSKNASGKLIKSLRYELNVSPNSFGLEIFMEKYGKFQDKGVSGKKRKFDTPYKYTTKRPPISAFNLWSVRKGLAGRNELGQFTKRKSLQFALAEYIYQYGIKPTLFLTKPFEGYFKELPDEVVDAYALDIEKFIKTTLG